jgi:hypothetical protein
VRALCFAGLQQPVLSALQSDLSESCSNTGAFWALQGGSLHVGSYSRASHCHRSLLVLLLPTHRMRRVYRPGQSSATNQVTQSNLLQHLAAAAAAAATTTTAADVVAELEAAIRHQALTRRTWHAQRVPQPQA